LNTTTNQPTNHQDFPYSVACRPVPRSAQPVDIWSSSPELNETLPTPNGTGLKASKSEADQTFPSSVSGRCTRHNFCLTCITLTIYFVRFSNSGQQSAFFLRIYEIGISIIGPKRFFPYSLRIPVICLAKLKVSRSSFASSTAIFSFIAE